MINIKFFVLLIVGIFLALGLGMMIGITLENQNIIENQQTQLIHQIEDHFDSLRIETEQMKLELEKLENQKSQLYELSSLLLTELVQDKLNGIHVGIINFSSQAPMKELLSFLDLAGASVQSAVTIFSNESDNSETMIHAAQQPDEMMSAIMQELLFCMNYGVSSPLVEEAEGLMIISHIGNYDFPVDAVILIGRGSSILEYDSIFIQNAKDAGVSLVAVGTGEMEDDAVLKYKSLGISTVDQLESIYGRLALTSILSGNRGNFDFDSEGLDRLPKPLFYQKSLSEIRGGQATHGGNLQ
jgi:hypothetical protein